MALPFRPPLSSSVPGAPGIDWRAAAPHDHFVQFYEDDAFLLDAVADYIGAALRDGEAGIVIATAEHRAGLTARLAQAGYYVATAQADSRYVALDAAATLAQFMDAGSPDPERFAGVVGDMLARAGRGGRPVRVFREMATLLAASGNHAVALQVERLWDELQQSHPFTLFCACPLGHFLGADGAAQLDAICAAHRRVIPAESYAALADPDDRMRAIVALQQQALRLEATVAARARAEEQLLAALAAERAARATTEAALRARDTFLSIAAHELRTPLTAMKGHTQLLGRRLAYGTLDHEHLATDAQALDRSVDRLITLTGDLLDVAQLSTGQLTLSPHPVDLAERVREAVARVRDRATAAHHVTLRVHAALPPLRADAERLNQILDRLLDNAVKYSPGGGEVAVTVRTVAAGAMIRVRDTGMGLPLGAAEVLFAPFGRAANAVASPLPGMGLGLAICRGIIELHGGWIAVASAGEGHGTTVSFWLPFAGPTAEGAARHTVVEVVPPAPAAPRPATWVAQPSSRTD